jgi:hypothetical protein
VAGRVLLMETFDLLRATPVWVLVLFVTFVWWFFRRMRISSEEAAHKMMQDFRGDYPPIESWRDGKYSPAFLAVVTSYYIEADAKKRAEVAERVRKERWTAWMLKNTKPLDPDAANDCPECDNTGPHPEPCRSGWKDVLRENVRKYAVAKFGSMPAWKKPCDTCGSNCGQCASSHCGICGVLPRDGECDLVQHEAYKLYREANPDVATMRCEVCGESRGLSRFDANKGSWSDWSCVKCGRMHRRG